MSEIAKQIPSAFGAVVIGRNEGERLRRCLESIVAQAQRVVYVDSGSTDDSVAMARTLGVTVVDLDLAIPFTAARARNEGFHRLKELQSDLNYVQFVDGDCEVVQGWMSKAVLFLSEQVDVAVVCGRRRERFPESSVYNLLCDIEWDTPVGQAKACGGDAMMRIEAIDSVGGFRPDLIAGEEPELCVRLRGAGWNIWRLGEEMTFHDAAMTRFGQWWKRTMRGGYAFAEGAHLHGAPPEMHWVRESRRARVWALGVPAVIVAGLLVWGWSGLALLGIYPVQIVRMALKGERSARENWLLAFFLLLGKFPEMLGQMKFLLQKVGAGRTALIEYK